MPVTLQIVDHPAVDWAQAKVPDSEKLLAESCPKHYRRCNRLIQSSFTRRTFQEGHLTPSSNGFVWAAYEAYSRHHHLILRPEDMWFAILTQLSFYINANAESLRHLFVAHEDQEHLLLEVTVLDFAYIANKITHLMAKKVLDPGLRDWVMPSFSTTTDSDKVVGAVLFMGAMQKYFSYGVGVRCGIPSVTLLGEVEDWRDIRERIDRIDSLGSEASLFAKMLRPILDHMVLSFQTPGSFEVTEFWNTIIHRNRLASGTDYFTGWLTAFCFWDEDGQAKRLSAARHMFEGDVSFPNVKVDQVPAGAASVPIAVDYYEEKYEATMVAGSVGISATAAVSVDGQDDGEEGQLMPHAIAPSDQTTTAGGGQAEQEQEPESIVRDTVQPLSGWWVYENESADEVEAREAEKAHLKKELNSTPLEDSSTRFKMSRRLRELEAY